jgi:RNA polymerase sigma-70 factor (ECF subfamily)
MALVLFHLAGLRVHEIAADMGIPQGTVKSHLSRGRNSLAGALGLQSDHTTGS